MTTKQTLETKITSMLNSTEATATEIEIPLTETDNAITAADAAQARSEFAAFRNSGEDYETGN